MSKKNEITTNDAITWTKLWREEHPDLCKAFLIPADDLASLLIEMNILVLQNGDYVLDQNKVANSGVRGYMAIDKSIKEGNGEKMVFVGTKVIDGKHKDIINTNVTDDYGMQGSGIYDFTQPCPTTCDLDSALNQ